VTGRITVHEAPVMRDGHWSFGTSQLTWGPPAPAHGSSAFDPLPAYPHDLAAVTAAAQRAQDMMPPLWDVDVYVADREGTDRCNGYSRLEEHGHYEGDDWVKDPLRGTIVLAGKRVQPHPAMSRYLVAHEYGHNVAYMLNSLRGGKYASACDGLYADYAKARGLDPGTLHHGDGGRWHDSAAEIFACDFRILVLGAEAEFWPHPGISRPEETRGLAGWWDDACSRLSAAA
jgi:hypothetical protein